MGLITVGKQGKEMQKIYPNKYCDIKIRTFVCGNIVHEHALKNNNVHLHFNMLDLNILITVIN